MSYDWRLMTLRDAGVVLIDCDHRTPPATQEGFPYIAIPQIKDGRLDLRDVRRISHVNFLNWTKKLRPKGHDVIVVRRCSSGDSAVVPPGLECAIGQNLVVLRSDGTVVDRRFLRWLLRSPAWYDQVEKFLNVGAVFDSLKCRDIPNFELLIPPMEVQHELVGMLGGLDERIVSVRETNQTLDELVQSIFTSWFVHFRPVHEKSMGQAPQSMDSVTAALFPSEFEESPIGKIPRGWLSTTVGEVSSRVFSGGTPDTRTAEFWNGQLNWFSSGETRNFYVVTTEKKITPEGVQHSSTRLAVPGDILIASAGQGHTRGQTSYCALDTYINQSVIAIRTNSTKCQPIWLFHNLRRRYEEMRTLSDSHSSRGSLTTKVLSGMPLCLPPQALIDAFVDHVSPMVEAQILGEQRILALTEIRDILLPRLLSGQLPVPGALQALEEALQ